MIPVFAEHIANMKSMAAVTFRRATAHFPE